MDFFLFSKYSVQAFTQLALSLLITGYLVTVQKKSKPTRLLVAFFIALSLALCNNLALLSLDAPWVMYIGGAQGAGLSSAYRIVQEHGGQIEIDSEVGRGTKVRIVLPRRRNRPAAA